MATLAEKMTAIADKIRGLLGLSGTMGLDAMASNLTTAQTETDTQADLIEQINTVLDGKAGGGSAVGVCSLEITATGEARITELAYAAVGSDGTLSYKTLTYSAASSVSVTDCACGTVIVVRYDYTATSPTYSNCERLYSLVRPSIFYYEVYGITAGDGETASVTTS